MGFVSPAQAKGIAADLRAQIQAHPDSSELRRIIVQFSRPIEDDHAVARAYGGWSKNRLSLINGAAMVLPQRLIEALERDTAVHCISPDRTVGAHWDSASQSSGASQVWSWPGYRGTGIRIAVLDTGVAPNSADWGSATGGSRVIAFQDFVNGQTSAYDDNGHGTHVAGVALGSGANSFGQHAGAAPGAELVSVKVLAQDGSGLVSTVISGLDWCVQNQAALNIRVISLSLGHRPEESYATDPLCAAVRRAVQAGIVVVVAAGNQGRNRDGALRYGGISSPANEPTALTVGALNTSDTGARTDDVVCTFSSRGPTYLDHLAKPDVLAPGNHIVSVRAPGSYLDSLHPGNRVTQDPWTGATDYFHLSGTSMAAPHVAGIVALLLEANGALQPNAVKGILTYTAQYLTLRDDAGQPLSPGLSLLTQGAGSVNAVGAVEVARQINAGAAVGSWWLPASPWEQSTVAGTTFPWGGKVPWAGDLLAGSELVAVRQQVWSDGSAWGAATTWSAGVQSSANGVAADQPAWSSAAIWSDPAAWWDTRIWSNQLTWSDSPSVAGDIGGPRDD